MKTYSTIGLIFMLFLTGFTHVISGQEYTYLLQVNSLGEQEQFFDLKITSKLSASPKPITIVLSDQTTPFMRMLETGEHVMIIEHLGGGGLVSKVTGFFNGESKGSAMGDDGKTILTAGPGGLFQQHLNKIFQLQCSNFQTVVTRNVQIKDRCTSLNNSAMNTELIKP